MPTRDPTEFKEKKPRDIKAIARSILHFPLNGDLKNPGKHIPDPDKFAAIVDEQLRGPMEDVKEPFVGDDPNSAFNRLVRLKDEMQALMDVLHYCEHGRVPTNAMKHLEKAPMLIELFAQHFDDLEKSARAEAASLTKKTDIDPEILNDPDAPAILRKASTPDGMEDMISGVVESAYLMKREAQNLRQHIAPLFAELAEAVKRTQERGGR